MATSSPHRLNRRLGPTWQDRAETDLPDPRRAGERPGSSTGVERAEPRSPAPAAHRLPPDRAGARDAAALDAERGREGAVAPRRDRADRLARGPAMPKSCCASSTTTRASCCDCWRPTTTPDPPVRSWRRAAAGDRARATRTATCRASSVGRRNASADPRVRAAGASDAAARVRGRSRKRAVDVRRPLEPRCSTRSRSRSRPASRSACGACAVRASRRCCGSPPASSCPTRASCASRAATSRGCRAESERGCCARRSASRRGAGARRATSVVVDHVALPALSARREHARRAGRGARGARARRRHEPRGRAHGGAVARRAHARRDRTRARARPSLVLVDEPGATPSPGDRDEIYALLRSLAKDPALTLVVASEDVAAIRAARRALTLSDGQMRSSRPRGPGGAVPARRARSRGGMGRDVLELQRGRQALPGARARSCARSTASRSRSRPASSSRSSARADRARRRCCCSPRRCCARTAAACGSAAATSRAVAARGRPLPAQRRRLRVPVLPSDAGGDGAGQRRAQAARRAALSLAGRAAARAAVAGTRRARRARRRTRRASCRRASASASRSRARSRTTRGCCSPTSRPATSTRAAAARCSRCCASSATSAGCRSCSSRTTREALRVRRPRLHPARRRAAARASTPTRPRRRAVRRTVSACRVGVLGRFYRWRLREHGVQELLAAAGIASASRSCSACSSRTRASTGSAEQLVSRRRRARRGSSSRPARRTASTSGSRRAPSRVPGVLRAAPVLRGNVALVGAERHASLDPAHRRHAALAQFGGALDARLRTRRLAAVGRASRCRPASPTAIGVRSGRSA